MALNKLKFSLLIVAFSYVFMLFVYFVVMFSKGNLNLSGNSQDWGGVGSYIGGLFTPIAALLSGYFVYISFIENSHQQKLNLVRNALNKLDCQLDEQLNKPFYYSPDISFKDYIYAISNGDVDTNDATNKAIVALLHDIAMLTNSVRYYIGLLSEVPSDKNDSSWLGELERSYWIKKYSPISNRMIDIVGEDALRSKATAEQIESLNFFINP
ncbi:hypothetical protein [Photobacterium leiognathi]|uniref:hypothetical protein n=1 Tax=Photobacterium leiognathi TaxID=553611 RepID=UPI002981B0F3|nr:hypothetical protein [Photobacterium leiognathi]